MKFTDLPLEEKRWLIQITMAQEHIRPADVAGWDAMVHHIDVHHYFISEGCTRPLQWGDAVFSWYENVYRPISEAIHERKSSMASLRMSCTDLFFAVSTHWYYLKEQNPFAGAVDALSDMIEKSGQWAVSA